jgi:hypothetical protein
MKNRLIHAASDDEIAEVGSVELYISADDVMESDFLVWIFETDDLFPVTRIFGHFLGNVCMAGVYELTQIFLMNGDAVRLATEAIVFEAEPFQAVDNVVLKLALRADFVCVLDTKEEFATVMASEKV